MYHGEYYEKIIRKIYYGKMMKHGSGNKKLRVGRLDTKQNRRGHIDVFPSCCSTKNTIFMILLGGQPLLAVL